MFVSIEERDGHKSKKILPVKMFQAPKMKFIVEQSIPRTLDRTTKHRTALQTIKRCILFEIYLLILYDLAILCMFYDMESLFSTMLVIYIDSR